MFDRDSLMPKFVGATAASAFGCGRKAALGFLNLRGAIQLSWFSMEIRRTKRNPALRTRLQRHELRPCLTNE
jgi:hypothetical protein